MISVTAKNLRDNLSDYLDRLQSGEEIVIIRHSEVVGTLKPANDGSRGKGNVIAAMLDRNRASFVRNKGLTNDSVSTKELYHQEVDKKYIG